MLNGEVRLDLAAGGLACEIVLDDKGDSAFRRRWTGSASPTFRKTLSFLT